MNRNGIATLGLIGIFWHATVIAAPQNIDKVTQFIAQQKEQLSPDFPYRINLFTQGQINKNNFGTRIAEEASQFPLDSFGQLFYYNLLEQGMRVPHWHANAVEVGTVLTGAMRVTIWEGKGEKKVFTVKKNNTWVIPQAALHSLENVGKSDLTFILTYNSPSTADVQFEQAWAMLPDEVLIQSTGLNKKEIQRIKSADIDKLSSFDPGADSIDISTESPYSSSFTSIKPLYQSALGSIKRIDSKSNSNMKEMSLQQTILKPGTLRLPHWYTAGDTFFYVAKGEGFFMMLDNKGVSYRAMIKPGDLVYLPVATFHGFLNTGSNDLEVYETFSISKDINEISLLDGAQHLNKGAVSGAMGLSKETIDRLIQEKPRTYMVPF
ncbi:MAG: hypothetical protein CK426_03690 [Legionella sp.]|nr:MAG: hypothetical protein CK423_05750 [Legionella sp.]PJD99118.1 MAG: hypothetical protein CK426_03690 [Legionella sp.]